MWTDGAVFVEVQWGSVGPQCPTVAVYIHDTLTKQLRNDDRVHSPLPLPFPESIKKQRTKGESVMCGHLILTRRW